MLTFKTPPSDDHFFSVFTNRIKHIPGLAKTMDNLRRVPYGHMDKNLQFLKDACLALVEDIHTDRQLAQFAKVYKIGGTVIALVMTSAEKKKAPLTFNVELVNGDLDAVVDKLGEVQKDVRDVVRVVLIVNPRKRSGSRRSKTPEAGALKTPVSK